MEKTVRIDMQTLSIKTEELVEEFTLFGNRGLVAKVLTSEVKPNCDPLGVENKLIVAMGLFAGTAFPTGSRASFGAKSPLTKGVKEANVGGTFGTVVGRHGIRLMIIENQASDNKLFMLKIGKDGSLELLPADKYRGMGNYESTATLKSEFGEKISVASIGSAGEMGYANSSIQITDHDTGHPSRSAARGGMGAVMGSKGLKAIVVEKPDKRVPVELADKGKFTRAMRDYMNILKRNMVTGGGLSLAGTMANMAEMGLTGVLPVRNFSGKKSELLSHIGVEPFLRNVHMREGKTGTACQPGCPIKCSNVYNNEEGDYITSGFEYETMALVGANCDINEMDVVAKIEKICDDFGLDTIETGATLGVCMEGGKLTFGDAQGALNLLEEMMKGTAFGKIMGQGTEATGKYLDVKRIPTVKGQAMAGYDPRNSKGTGVTYATTPQGADHTAGATASAPGEHLKEGRVATSQKAQVALATVDNLMCMFCAIPILTSHTDSINLLADAMAGKFGGEWDMNKLVGIGLETLMMEKAFNKGAGFTNEDDRLPEFLCKEPSPHTGNIFDVPAEELDMTIPF